MEPRRELEKRYPAADFSAYFCFLAACAAALKDGATQEHHICPRKQFPEFLHALENIISLTLEEHKRAHKLLGNAVPSLRTGYVWLTRAADGSRICREKGVGIYAQGAQAAFSRSRAKFTNHKRWHLDRNITAAACSLCEEQACGG